MSSYRLRLLGSPAILREEGVVGGRVSQRHRLALLALLATAADHTSSRDRLIALLWPDSSTSRARHLLSVAIHEIRKALGEVAIVASGDDLRLDPNVILPDVVLLRSALARGESETVVATYTGPFLEGFHLTDNLEFDEWADRTRAELADLYEKALERLAVAAEGRNDPVAAAKWWIELGRAQPYSGWIVGRAMKALTGSGDRGRALLLAQDHDALMRREFSTGADPEIAELVERLRAETSDRETFIPGEASRRDATPSIPRPTRVMDGAKVGGDPRPAASRAARRWIRGASLVAASTAALFVGGGSGRPLLLQPDLVHVPPIENESGDPGLDAVGRLARDAVVRALAETGAVRVATRDQRHEARLAVLGAFHREGGRLAFRARVEDVGSGETIRVVEGIVADPAAPAEGARDFGRRVAGALATAVDPRLSSWAHAASQPPSPAAYREFVRGIDEFARFNMREAIGAFDRAAAEEPGFTAPHLWVAFAYQLQWGRAFEDSVAAALVPRRGRMAPWDQAMLEYYLARSRGDLPGAYEAMRRVVDLVPDAPEWRFLLAHAALDVNRPRETAKILDATDLEASWLRGVHDAWTIYDTSLHVLGECKRENGVRRREHALDPLNHFMAMGESEILFCEGRVREGVALMEEELESLPSTRDGRWNRATALAGAAMELQAHGHHREAREVFDHAFAVFDSFPSLKDANRFIYGMLLYEAGRWSQAEEVFRTKKPYTGFGPVDVELEGYRALIAARLGRIDEARKAAVRLETLPAEMKAAGGRHGYYEVQGAIYRARIAAVLGEREEAVTILRKLLVGGMSWRYIMMDVHNTIDYLELRGYPLFDELVRPKG